MAQPDEEDAVAERLKAEDESWDMIEQTRQDIMRWGPLPEHLKQHPLDHDAIMLWYAERMLEDAKQQATHLNP